MNYEKHYNLLIERGRSRKLTEYTEKHRIVPGCIGGKYDEENVVRLTPEEHFVAHQLLVKIYPNVPKLVFAVNMMTISINNGKRNNKRYGWIRREYSKACKQRVGPKNGMYGKRWFYNPETGDNILIDKDNPPRKFKPGKIVNQDQMIKVYCISCSQMLGIKYETKKSKLCATCRINKKYNQLREGSEKYALSIEEGDTPRILKMVSTSKTWSEALQKLGLTDGNTRYRIRRIAEKHNVELGSLV